MSLTWDKVVCILLGATAYILLGTLLVNLVIDSPYLAFGFTLGLVVVVLLSTSPLKALSSVVFIVPFTGTTLLNGALIPLPGAKPLQILALFVVIISVINYKKAVPIPDYLFFFTLAILLVFTISIVRSLFHLDIINQRLVDKLSPHRFILSAYIKPLISFMPLIVIVKFARRREDLKFMVNMVCCSILMLSCLIVYLYFFRSLGSTGSVREYYHTYFGFHTNSIVNFYIVSFPFVIASFFLSKSIVNLVNPVISLVAVGFLFSRSGYVICLAAIVVYLVVSKRAKMIPLLVVLAVMAFIFVVPENIIERASKGMKAEEDGDISAGRIENLWIPLIDEYSRDFKKLAVGGGRYAIRFTEAARRGRIFIANHPHNMYLEQVLDAGFIGLVTFLLFYFVLVRKTYRCMGAIKDGVLKEYQCATLVSLLSYFVSGFTDRSFFPVATNGFLWVIVGITAVIIRMQERVESEISKVEGGQNGECGW